MTDGDERPEDAARRFAGELTQLQQKYAMAMELWDALEFKEGDLPLDGVLLVRAQNANQPGASTISITATDGVDFSRQLGMLHESILLMTQDTDRD